MKAVAALLLLPSLAAAQTSLGPSIQLMLGDDFDISGSCLSDRHFAALGVHLTHGLGSRVTVQIVARGYVLGTSPSCVDGLVVPRSDGTYDVEHHDPLQSESFLTTDARIGLTAPNNAVMLSVGGGTAWRAGHDAPHLVVGVTLPMVDGVRRRFGVQIEYAYLRLTTNRTRQTWQGGGITNEVSIEPVHHWAGAIMFGVRWGLPL